MSQEINLYTKELIFPAHLTTGSGFPWQKRSSSEWKSFSKNHLITLLALAAKSDSIDLPEDYESIVRWSRKWALEEGVTTFWRDEHYNEELHTDVTTFLQKYFHSRGRPVNSEKFVAPFQDLIFRPNVLTYLTMVGTLYNDSYPQNLEVYNPTLEKSSERELGISAQERTPLRDHIKQLLALYKQSIQKATYRHFRDEAVDKQVKERWEEEQLKKTFFQFCWEASIIDPSMTINIFIQKIIESVNKAESLPISDSIPEKVKSPSPIEQQRYFLLESVYSMLNIPFIWDDLPHPYKRIDLSIIQAEKIIFEVIKKNHPDVWNKIDKRQQNIIDICYLGTDNFQPISGIDKKVGLSTSLISTLIDTSLENIYDELSIKTNSKNPLVALNTHTLSTKIPLLRSILAHELSVTNDTTTYKRESNEIYIVEKNIVLRFTMMNSNWQSFFTETEIKIIEEYFLTLSIHPTIKDIVSRVTKKQHIFDTINQIFLKIYREIHPLTRRTSSQGQLQELMWDNIEYALQTEKICENNPQIWNLYFSPRQQTILYKYYLETRNTPASHTKVAKEMGTLSASIVKRELNLCKKTVRKLAGQPYGCLQ